MVHKKKQRSTFVAGVEELSTKATNWIGSTESIITHTILFVGIFGLALFGVSFSLILLILTTLLSLEAIYLAIFIQISINKNTAQLQEVGKEIEEISEDMEEISEDVEDIQKDVEEISEDVEDIQKDVDEISEDMEEIQEDIEDDASEKTLEQKKFACIEKTLAELMKEIQALKK